MAATNERVVRRSNALLGYRYGRDLRYHEVMRTGRGLRGWARAAGLAVGLGAFTAALVSPLRGLVMRRLPAPGEGPTREAIEGGSFDVRLVGWRAGERVVEVLVHGDKDPGYGATACMLVETALALALGEAAGEPGVSTPAAAVGMPLVERLNRSLVQFRVVDAPAA
jgi:short subunit dehydrogenase-like uncharacterized protein